MQLYNAVDKMIAGYHHGSLKNEHFQVEIQLTEILISIPPICSYVHKMASAIEMFNVQNITRSLTREDSING